MKLRMILTAIALAVATLTTRIASAACDPCQPGSGCEPACIDNGAHNPPIAPWCSCGKTSTIPQGPVCPIQEAAWQIKATVPAGGQLDWDLSASIPHFGLSKNWDGAGCNGYVICETSYSGSGDTWQNPYIPADGHTHWNVGSMGNGIGGDVTAIINAWPILGTGYTGEPGACGSDCEMRARIDSVTSQPGQGPETFTLTGNPLSPSNNSWTCITGREGDLGLGSGKDGISAFEESGSNPPMIYSTSPPGSPSYAYIRTTTVSRLEGPIHRGAITTSSSTSNVLLGNNCIAAGFMQIYTNNEFITFSGTSASLGETPGQNVTQGWCLTPQ